MVILVHVCVTVQIYMVVHVCYCTNIHGCTVLVHVCYCTIIHGCTALVHVCYCTIVHGCTVLVHVCCCTIIHAYTYTCVTCVTVLCLCFPTDVRTPSVMIFINFVIKCIGLYITSSVCLCWGQWMDFAVCSDHATPGVEMDVPNSLQHVQCLEGEK